MKGTLQFGDKWIEHNGSIEGYHLKGFTPEDPKYRLEIVSCESCGGTFIQFRKKGK